MSGGQNGLATALAAVLRAALSEVELPHMDRIRHRTFDFSRAAPSYYSESLDNSVSGLDAEISAHLPSSSPLNLKGKKKEMLLSSEQSNFSSSRSSLSTPSSTATNEIDFRQFCPEFALLDWEPPPPSPFSQIFFHPNSSTSRRDVFTVFPTNCAVPGAPYIFARSLDTNSPLYCPKISGDGAKFLSSSPGTMNNIDNATSDIMGPNPNEPEYLVRKSIGSIKKVIYEQTARILKPGVLSDLLVYDAMDESVKRGVKSASIKYTYLLYK
jgi:hypothetical protein